VLDPDGAGVVEAVGDNMKNLEIGDEVLVIFSPVGRGVPYQKFAVV
jgi:Zn-dependent alcohol dehydrogenase